MGLAVSQPGTATLRGLSLTEIKSGTLDLATHSRLTSMIQDANELMYRLTGEPTALPSPMATIVTQLGTLL